MHTSILKRCGVVLVVVGAIDIAYMIWCVSRGQSYSSSFNIFALIGGIFLIRGSLRVAKWVAMLSSFMLTACLGAALTMPLLFPLGYWIAIIRDGVGALSILLFACMVGLLYWLRRELHRVEVLSAQSEAGVARPKVATPIVAGVLLPIVLVGLLSFMFRGDTAKEAMRRAEQQVGSGYHFVVTNMQMRSTTSEKSVYATVAAYNDLDMKTIHVRWKE